MTNTSNSLVWNEPKKLAFRFFFILLILFITLNNNEIFLYSAQIFHYPTAWFNAFIPWFSKHILLRETEIIVANTGSGDTTYDYILMLVMAIISGLGAVIWSALDWRRQHYNKLYYYLIVLVRFYLALTLFSYGSIKIIQLQFPKPSLYRLVEPFGDASPMGLAWTFLGFSKGYNMFMGIIEASALLLLFRRTMVIGAFLSLAASVHVMTMNYFFDVPVKILSTALVFMCLFILSPYLKTILKFFIKGDAQQLPVMYNPTFKKSG